VLTVIAFNMVAMLVLVALPPVAGLLWVVLLTASFYAWSVRPGRRRLARLRVRAPDGPARYVALGIGASLLLLFGIATFIGLIAPEIDAGDIPDWYTMLDPYRESIIGWAALSLLIAGAIPLVEEFCFRGHIQRLLEKRVGVPVAVVLSALLFMSLHVGGPHWSILGISLTVGLTCGLAVHHFRSIWPAVLTHAAWNGCMLGAEGLAEALPGADGTTGVSAAVMAVVLVTLGVAGWRVVLRSGGSMRRESVKAPR
jgi:uncharacterized protein